VDFAPLTTPQDRVCVVATEPLTQGEPWQRLAPGEMRVFVGGQAVAAGPLEGQ
jgi:predicted glutamine amidotransferase